MTPLNHDDISDWDEIMYYRSRDDGGIAFSKKTKPVIDICYAPNFLPLIHEGFEQNTDQIGLDPTDFHVIINADLFERLAHYYNELDYNDNGPQERYDLPGGHVASVGIDELIPLILKGEETEVVVAYYCYISASKPGAESEEFAVFVLNPLIGITFVNELRALGLIRRQLLSGGAA
jgi:hypothetical protein